MKIYEDYIQRHGLQIVSVVEHSVAPYSFIFKADGRWIIIVCSWHEPGSHPGQYTINQYAIRDSVGYGNNPLRRLTDEIRIPWSEYDEWFFNWIRDYCNGSQILVVPKNVNHLCLCVWESFLISHDSWIVSSCDKESIELIHNTIEPNKSIDEKKNCVEKIMSLQSQVPGHPSLRQCYDRFMSCFGHLRISDQFPFWLSRLFENEKVRTN